MVVNSNLSHSYDYLDDMFFDGVSYKKDLVQRYHPQRCTTSLGMTMDIKMTRNEHSKNIVTLETFSNA